MKCRSCCGSWCWCGFWVLGALNARITWWVLVDEFLNCLGHPLNYRFGEEDRFETYFPNVVYCVYCECSTEMDHSFAQITAIHIHHVPWDGCSSSQERTYYIIVVCCRCKWYIPTCGGFTIRIKCINKSNATGPPYSTEYWIFIDNLMEFIPWMDWLFGYSHIAMTHVTGNWVFNMCKSTKTAAAYLWNKNIMPKLLQFHGFSRVEPLKILPLIV